MTVQNKSARNRIREIIESVPRPARPGKCGKELHEAIVLALRQLTDFRVVKEDTTRFLEPQMPVWRDKQTEQIVPTAAQRKIDIVLYEGQNPTGLIEVESDLNDLQLSGVSKRNGHYDVFSIARSANGCFFHSYKSLERMAAAAIYRNMSERDQTYPSQERAVKYLESLRSDSPTDHNPLDLPMFLVAGSCRPDDGRILNARLKSLNADLICKN